MLKVKRLFEVKSADRQVAADDPSNCSITISVPPEINFTHVCVMAMDISKSYYLIQGGYNTFTLVDLGQNITITLTPANYSATQFRTEVAAKLTAASTHAMRPTSLA